MHGTVKDKCSANITPTRENAASQVWNRRKMRKGRKESRGGEQNKKHPDRLRGPRSKGGNRARQKCVRHAKSREKLRKTKLL